MDERFREIWNVDVIQRSEKDGHIDYPGTTKASRQALANKIFNKGK